MCLKMETCRKNVSSKWRNPLSSRRLSFGSLVACGIETILYLILVSAGNNLFRTLFLIRKVFVWQGKTIALAKGRHREMRRRQ